jgi:hypothetical protein
MNVLAKPAYMTTPFSELDYGSSEPFYDVLNSEEEELWGNRKEEMVWRIYSTSGTGSNINQPLRSTEEKIRSFLNLPTGWNHGEGITPSHQVFQIAVKINSHALKEGFLTDAVPGLNGEIQVAVYTHDEWPSSYLELTTYNDFSLNLTRYDYFEGKWEIKEDLFLGSIEEVKSSITDYGREIHPWRVTSEYYPKDTITNDSEGFQVRPSRTIKVTYQWYKNYVFQTDVIKYATT